MEWLLMLGGLAALVLVGHGLVVLVYARGSRAVIDQRLTRYVAGGE